MELSWPIIYEAMERPTDKGIIVGILGTIAKETASTFLPVREAFFIYSRDPVEAERLFQANPAPAYRSYNDTSVHAKYEGGPDYHGRGYIQTTHIYNYQKVQDRTGIPCVVTPDLLLEPENAAKAFELYWNDRNISDPASRMAWLEVRRRVFGGTDNDGAARMQRIYESLP